MAAWALLKQVKIDKPDIGTYLTTQDALPPRHGERKSAPCLCDQSPRGGVSVGHTPTLTQRNSTGVVEVTVHISDE